MNVFEHNGQFVAEVAVPGMKAEEVIIDFTPPNIVTISGKVTFSDVKASKNVHCRELSQLSFERSIALPDTVNAGKDPKITLVDGLLTMKWDLITDEPKITSRKLRIES
jgi:HSP20 family molecular chaperone IbpA